MVMWKKGLNFLLAMALLAGLALPVQAADVTGETEPAVTAETEGASQGIPVDEGHFPDGMFRAFVLETCDADGDGSLREGEIGAVTELDVSNQGITSLAGVEFFGSLRVLECQGNSLTELDLSGNPALEELRCYRNGLKSLDVGNCPELRSLYCGKNMLTSLKLEGNPKLSILQCQENSLSKLDVSHCPNLDFLVCSDNALPFLDLTANSKLTQVQAEGNAAMQNLMRNAGLDLAAVPGFDPSRASNWEGGGLDGTLLTPEARAERLRFTYDMGRGNEAVFTWQLPSPEGIPIDERHFPDENFRLVVSHDLDTTPDGILTPEEVTAATRIQAESFEISSLEGLSYFSELRELFCGGNRLPFVDVSANPQLTELSAGENAAALEGCWDRTLDLAAVPGFDPARASGWEGASVEGTILTAFEGVDTLHFIYDADGDAGEKTVALTWELSFPPKPEGTPIDGASFPDEALRAWVLANCDPDGNGVLSLEEAGAVTALEVPDAGIATLAGAEIFANLRRLNCENNGLTQLNPGLWPKLEALNCVFNSLTELDVSKNGNLTSLLCAHNKLTALNLADCPELRTLDCRDNGLDMLDVSRNDRLISLSCGENRLEELDVRKCSELTDLNCDYNCILELKLPESGALQKLSGCFNRLTQLDVSRQNRLVWLLVGGNPLTELNLPGHPLEKLAYSNEPLTDQPSETVPEETPPEETVPEETEAGKETCGDGHTLGPWIDRVRPTCAQTGVRAHRDCEVCGRHFDKKGRELTDLVLAKEPGSHLHTEHIPKVKETCTEDGFTAGTFCRDCGTYISGHTRIPARHALTHWIRAVKATDTRPGVPGHFDCKVCGKHFDADGREIPDLNERG